MTMAWIENGVVRDVAPGNPATLYHPTVAAFYDTDVPEGIRSGATMVGGVWTNPPEPEPVDPPAPSPAPAPVVSVIEFMQLFTIAEQAALRAQARVAPDHVDFDPAFDAFWQMLNHPQLTHVNLGKGITITGVNYLETAGLIGEGRAAIVLAGTEPS